MSNEVNCTVGKSMDEWRSVVRVFHLWDRFQEKERPVPNRDVNICKLTTGTNIVEARIPRKVLKLRDLIVELNCEL
jgi:hypothetical protein